MFPQKHIRLHGWIRVITVMLLLGLLLPAGSVTAQDGGPLRRQVPAGGDPTKQAGAAESVGELVAGDIIQDGSFESSYGYTGYWNQYSYLFGTPLCTSGDCGDGAGTAGPRTGSVWGWYGGYELAEEADVWQNVTIPASCTVSLQFYLWIGYAGAYTGADDVFIAYVDGTDVFTTNATRQSSFPSYTLVTVDVSAFADGGSHTVGFYSLTHGTGNYPQDVVSFNLDDVALVVQNCPISGNAGTVGVTLGYNDGGALAPAVADLRRFIVRAAEALTTGGVHTPNHRWVVCAALAEAHALAPDPRYVSRIDAWLAETIDIDPDGQYTERSTTVYSPVVDRALLTVARIMDRPALREPVRRNLDMTLYYVHPDGEVVTEASRRQDRYQRGTLARYYYAYRTMARLDGDGRFAAVARRLEREERPALVGDLPAFLEEPAFSQPLPPDAPVPADFARVFAHSSLARIRRGALSATIITDNASWFSLRRGAAALEAVRLASAFFGKGQFTGARLNVSGGRYSLRQTLDGPYFQPFTTDQIAGGVVPKLTPNGTLAADIRAIRGRSNVQTLDTVALVEEAGGGFTLSLSVDGTAEVPVALELAFRPQRVQAREY